MSHLGTGMLLVLQFFSVFPVKKELPLEKNDVTAMYGVLPVLGALFGSLISGCVFVLSDYTDLSSLLMAFVVVVLSLVLTGGLHMDGMADVGDAYFSYQDRTKRLEIMGDPRIGAFGAMVLILAIAGKVIVIAEAIPHLSLLAIAAVPILSRTGLLLLFSVTESAKKDGLAAFFQKRSNRKLLFLVSIGYLAAVLVLLGVGASWGVSLALIGMLLASFKAYRQWCLRNFGGMTGDLFGAYVEGTELLLWTTLLFFI
ncbi:adenosylcobinamide-GDP ribazoletransferase [Planococcus sp. YIM B11945]|uniref:adenosylcobinamide-GDP ribazoletransferase n=1 Tax=Planococcus sp. YIM B11945 TaxID=3435410 RepID=UPI003D7ED02E